MDHRPEAAMRLCEWDDFGSDEPDEEWFQGHWEEDGEGFLIQLESGGSGIE